MATYPIADASEYLNAGLQSEPELADLMNEVAAEIPGKWHDVGIQLKLSTSDLDCLRTLSLPTSQLFSSVFTLWKKRTTDDYSWATIIKVLKTPAVDEIRLAEKLNTKLIGH